MSDQCGQWLDMSTASPLGRRDETACAVGVPAMFTVALGERGRAGGLAETAACAISPDHCPYIWWLTSAVTVRACRMLLMLW
jgi:hypothetical protein